MGEILIGAWHSIVAGLPVLLVHLATTTALFFAGLAIYVWVTPYREIALVRQGNIAAAISLTGQMLALGIPLSAMMAHSVSLPDILLWGIVTVILQLVAFGVVAIVIRNLPQAIERGAVAPALLLAGGQIVAGLLNAAAMSG
jgi:putative membrane protein